MMNKERFNECKKLVLGFSNLVLVAVLKERIEEETLNMVSVPVVESDPTMYPIPEETIAPTLVEEGVSVSNMKQAKKMYKAVCADCNMPCEVPFDPDPTRPVSCLDCYKKRTD